MTLEARKLKYTRFPEQQFTSASVSTGPEKGIKSIALKSREMALESA